ncbi:MAG TPA: Ig-like domain-containing protein, partial [Anaerolineae bacterium]
MLNGAHFESDSDARVVRIALSDGAPPDRVVIHDTQLLFSAKFKKVGADLILTGEDGKTVVLVDYFQLAKRPDLVSADGATLSASLVERLAGPENPGQYAQAGAPAGAQVIGRVERVSGSATVQHANGVVEELRVGDAVYKGDVVQTGDGSALALSFVDGTAFNMSTNARMVLNELVYEANSPSNSALISLVRGTFTFVAGQIAKTGDMRVDTPVATMGIRGTTVNTTIDADIAGNVYSVTYSLMTDPDGRIGSFQVLDRVTGAVLATVASTGTLLSLTPTATLQVLAQETQKTPAQIQTELAVAQILFPIFLSNPANITVPPQPQDLQPRSPQAPHTQVPYQPGQLPQQQQQQGPQGEEGNGGETREITLRVTIDIFGEDQQTFQQQITAVVPANFAPLISVETPPPVIEATSSDPGTPIASAHIVISDIEDEAAFDVAALTAAGWIDLGGGNFSRTGSFGTATLDTTTSIITYTLNNALADSLGQGDVQLDTFVIAVVDALGATTTASVDFTVTGVNDPPLASDDGQTTGEDTLLSASVPAASDVDGVIASYALAGGVAQGVLSFGADGSYTFDPNGEFEYLAAGAQQVVSFSYVALDDAGAASAVASVALTVTGVNDAPLASDDGQTTGEDTLLSASVPAASDVDGVIASYALAGGVAQGV